MKLVSYLNEEHEQLAMLVNDFLYNTDDVHPELPSTMSMMLNYWDDYFPLAQALNESILQGKVSRSKGIAFEDASLLSPVTQPASLREAYAFRQHTVATMRNDQAETIAAFDQIPVFSFANHHSIQGQGAVPCMPDHLQKLDFQPALAIVICKHGRNIVAAEAHEYIGGYMIMNSFIARQSQMEGMYLNPYAAKGKDFATCLGPWLVTPDELEPLRVSAGPGHTGHKYNLNMMCRVNGVKVSEGSMAVMNWTFSEIIERCAYGADIYPGDIIGSGGVNAGCFLELNQSDSAEDSLRAERWLVTGDRVELEIDGLGVLTNAVIAEDNNMSILKADIQ